MIDPTTQAALDEYRKRQSKRAGSQLIGRVDASKLGEQPKYPAIEPGKEPEATGLFRFLEPVSKFLEPYTKVMYGLGETIFNKVAREAIRWHEGEEAVETYDAKQRDIADRAARRVDELGGGIGGFLGATGEMLTEMSDLSDTRPEFFPTEKFLESLAADPTTYMGWGVFSKLPVVGKGLGTVTRTSTLTKQGRVVTTDLGIGLGLVMDVAPRVAWQQTFGRLGSLASKTLEKTPLIHWPGISLLVQTPKSRAITQSDSVRETLERAFSPAALMTDEIDATRDVIAAFKQVGQQADITDAGITDVLKKFADTVDSSLLHTAREISPLLTDELIERMNYMPPRIFIDEMAHVAQRRVLDVYDEKLAAAKKSANFVQRQLLRLMAPQAHRPMGWAQRWLVSEPARAVLWFLNYGPFNNIEEIAKIAETGNPVYRLDKLPFDWSTEGLGRSRQFAGGLLSELEQITEKRVSHVPALVRPFNWATGGKLQDLTEVFPRVSEGLRRGAVHSMWYYPSVAKSHPAVKAIVEDIYGDLPPELAKLSFVPETFGSLAIRVQPDGVRLMPEQYAKAVANVEKLDSVLAQKINTLPTGVGNVLLRRYASAGNMAFSGAGRVVTKEQALAMLEQYVVLDPRVFAKPIDDLLAQAEKAPVDELVRRIQDIQGAFTAYDRTGATMHAMREARKKAYHEGDTWQFLDETGRVIDEAHRGHLDRLEALVAKLKATAPSDDIVRSQDELVKIRRNGWQKRQDLQKDLDARFFPDPKAPTGRKGVNIWRSQITRLANGDKAALDELPTEWRVWLAKDQSLNRWLDMKAAGQFTAKEVAAELEHSFWLSRRDAAIDIVTRTSSTESFGHALQIAQDAISSDAGKRHLSDEFARYVAQFEKRIELPNQKALRETNPWKEGENQIDLLMEESYRATRRDAVSEAQTKMLTTYANHIAEKLDALPDSVKAAQRAMTQAEWQKANDDFFRIFPDYNRYTGMSAAIKLVDPFYTYQSQSWPYLIGAMMRKPGLAATMVPGGRYWEATDGGYSNSDIAGLQFSAVRGSILGRFMRLQRGSYPPRHGGEDYPEKILGQYEQGLEWAASAGFFPGPFVSTLTQGVLGLVSGGDIGDVPEAFIENLPPAIATAADGIVAASRLAGPDATLYLAKTIFQNKYQDYYMVKALWDSHRVSPDQARRLEHEDWIADAYQGVALRGMIEEQLSLTKFNPESWKELQNKVAQETAKLTGVSVERQAEIKKSGRRLSEVVVLNRTDRAKLAMVEGIEALAEASTPLSDKARQAYLKASQDYYSRLRDWRKRANEEQESDDAQLEAVTMTPYKWRKNYADRWSEYRISARRALEFEYFRQLGTDAETRQAVRERYGMAPPLANPVDEVLDAMFALEPKINYLGEEDWDGLFDEQDELIATLPVEDQKAVKDYLQRNLTPTVKEFREGRRVTAPYMRPEIYVPRWYRSLGRPDMAELIEDSYVELQKEELAYQRGLLNGAVPDSRRRSELGRFLKRHADEYKYRVTYVPGTPGYSSGILPFIRKFYGQVGPRA